MIEINKPAVNEAGRLIFKARTCFNRHDLTMCRMYIKQARALLYTESNWRADGHEQVQRYLNFVIGLDQDLIQIADCDMAIPREMAYFGREPNAFERLFIEKAVPA